MDELGLPTRFGRPDQRKRFGKNSHRSNKKPQILNHIVDKDVEAVFNKHFSFFNDKQCDKNKCKLPEPSSLFQEEKWNVEQFQQLKTILNDTKSKLNDLNLKKWHFHTTNTNTAGDVMKKLRFTLGPEFLTQAWCKMYECLSMFWMVPQQFQGGQFNSVHLCEAPGAFITALNHFLQTWYPDTQWDWLATTLNPYHESNPLSHMIQDDRFILHTLGHWTFGRDGTGNLMDPDNLRHLQEQVENRLGGRVMLVTADGSVDCQTNPAEQESIVAPLHYCETLAALSILQPGGSFMLKMFTLLECESICLLYLLVCAFNTVSVFKPVKSKEGNSEVYVVCTEYVGVEKLAPWLPTLLEKFGSTIPKAMFAEKDIPEEFKMQVYECAKKFTDMQIGVIERNLELFHFPSPPKLLHSRLIKQKVADVYLEHYEMQPIDKYIVGNHVLGSTPSFNLAQKQEEGTFNDRVRRAAPDQPHEATVHQLWQRVVEVSSTCVWPHNASVCWFVFNTKQMPEVQVTVAQPVTRVCSSKFCNGRMLEVFSQLNYPPLHMSLRTDLSTSVTVDVRQLPWFTESSRCNLQLLERISQALQTLPVSKSLYLRGLPLFTQFTVAVVFLLAHSFYQVGLTVEGDVILCGYRQAVGVTDWVGSVLAHMRRLAAGDAVLSLLPINILCDPSYSMKDGESFYMWVSRINNALLLRSIESEVNRILQSDPAILQSDPAILQSGPAILQSDAMILQSNSAVLQSDPAIPQSESMALESDPAILQSDPAILQSGPAIPQNDSMVLQSNPAVLQSDPAIPQSESMALESDPAILQSGPAILQNDSMVLQSNPAVLQSDPAIPQSESMVLESDPEILQSDPAILQSNPAILQSDPAILKSDPAILQSGPAILQSDSMILQSNPAVLQSDPAIPQSESVVLESDPAILQSDPAILQSDPTILQSDSAILQSDPAILQSGPAILQSDPAIPQSESMVLESDPVILRSEPAILQKHSTTLKSNPVKLQNSPAIMPSDSMILQSDPAILQSKPGTLQSDPTILKSVQGLLKSGPAIRQSDPMILQRDPIVRLCDPALQQNGLTILQIDPAILQSGPAILQSEPAILQSDPAILKSGPPIVECDPAILQSDPAILQSEPAILQRDAST